MILPKQMATKSMPMVVSAVVSSISVVSLSSPSFGLSGSRRKSWLIGLPPMASLNPLMTLQIGEMKMTVQHTQPTGRFSVGYPRNREVSYSTQTNIDFKQAIKLKSSPTSILPMFSSRGTPHWSLPTDLLMTLINQSMELELF